MVPWPPRLTALLVYSAIQSYASTGFTAILVKYLEEWLHTSSNTSTVVFSSFIALLNLFGVVGGLLADWRWGSYKTLFWSAWMWAAGSAVLFLGAVSSSISHPLRIASGAVGIVLVAVGSGAQQPTQAAFLGDQTSGDASQFTRFFSWYYFWLNIGSFGGESLCPVLREHVSVSVALLSIAALQGLGMLALSCSPGFVRVDPPTLPEVAKQQNCMVYHLSSYSREDWAALKRILVIFSPLPFYWALFYQQNSTWVDQASSMNTAIVWHTPDALASAEDLMVLILVPLFSQVVYPMFKSCYPCSPLRKMTVGMCASVVAFVLAGFVQLAIDHSEKKISAAWQLPQYLFIAIGETMVGVTGLEFAYSQCGPHLKSLVQALWSLMQVGQLLSGALALGDVNAAKGFFIGSGALSVFIIIFAWLSTRYVYHDCTPGYVGLEDSTSGVAGADIVGNGNIPSLGAGKLSGNGHDSERMALIDPEDAKL